jgi:hypothetical protein
MYKKQEHGVACGSCYACGLGPSPFAQPGSTMSAFVNFVVDDWYFAFPLFLMLLTGIGLVLWRLLLKWNEIVSDIRDGRPAGT